MPPLAESRKRSHAGGAPAVVVVAVEDYQRLCRAEQAGAPSFVEHLLAIPKGGPDDVFDRQPLKLRDVEW